MELIDLIRFTFDRVWTTLDRGLEGLTDEEITRRPNGHSNSIGWIAWHMARVEDRWFQTVLIKKPQLWETVWAEKLGMPADPGYAGGGMKLEDVDRFKTPTAQQIKDYYAAVRQATRAYIGGLTPEAYDREIETFFGRTWTVGQLFGHLLCELNQHAGQVSYLKGYYKGYQERVS
ncbi:MAG: DinB family protein [Dehalococcoidia bacterium]